MIGGLVKDQLKGVTYFKSVSWNLPAETGISLKSSMGISDLGAEI
jgi:hypothetical protein